MVDAMDSSITDDTVITVRVIYDVCEPNSDPAIVTSGSILSAYNYNVGASAL